MKKLPRARKSQKKKSPTGIRAVIFDLDGVLVDSESVFARIVERFLRKEYKIALTEEDLSNATGRSDDGLFNYVLCKYKIAVDPEKYKGTAWKYFRERKRIPRTKNALRTVRSLSRKFPLAVASSSYYWYVEKFLRNEGFRKYLKFCLGRENVRNAKPSPEIYLLAAKRLRIPPKNCLVIEDSFPGISAAKRAGMTCFALKGPHNPAGIDRSKADRVISDLSELIEILS